MTPEPVLTFLLIGLLAAQAGSSPAEELNVKGNDLAKVGKLTEAIALYTKAIELDPEYVEPYYNRGKAKLNLEDHRGAVADFDRALKLTPTNADTYNNRGIARKKLGDLRSAPRLQLGATVRCPALSRVLESRHRAV